METQSTLNISELTAEIVAAYVSNNSVRPEDLASLISDVHSAIKQTPSGKAEDTRMQCHRLWYQCYGYGQYMCPVLSR